jgi:hypothetical protein
MHPQIVKEHITAPTAKVAVYLFKQLNKCLAINELLCHLKCK